MMAWLKSSLSTQIFSLEVLGWENFLFWRCFEGKSSRKDMSTTPALTANPDGHLVLATSIGHGSENVVLQIGQGLAHRLYLPWLRIGYVLNSHEGLDSLAVAFLLLRGMSRLVS